MVCQVLLLTWGFIFRDTYIIKNTYVRNAKNSKVKISIKKGGAKMIELPFICPICGTEITNDDVISNQKQEAVIHKIQCSKCNFSKIFSIDTE